ncbi:putative TauD/TfdA-like domain-containing protein [Seiridium cardinale]
MSPIAIDQTDHQEAHQPSKAEAFLGIYKEQANDPNAYNRKLEEEGSEDVPKATYQNYLPTFNPTQKYPPLKPFTHVERGIFADKSFPELLNPSVQVENLTPTIGTTISGIQLSSLSDAGKDQLALLCSERKVLHFLDQDFASLPISKALEFGSHFGRHHIHPTSGSPDGYPEVHLVYRGANEAPGAAILEGRTSTTAWHSDVSYEEQPPGTTILYILDKPSTGGDTIFVDQVEAYRRLSSDFRERLRGLKVVHSGIEQVNASKVRGSICRREPVASVHPIVRTQPATGDKALFVNPQFMRQVVGWKKEESDMLLQFLNNHIVTGADFQVRVKWQANSVVIFDNRITSHSALLDWTNGQRRYLARITPQAEKPFESY